MSRLRIQIRLALTAWPFFIAILLIVAHCAAIEHLPYPAKEINKLISLVLQLVGGFFVLWSIDSNMGVMTGVHLKQSFLSFFDRIKQAGRAVSITVNGIASATAIGNATLNTRKIPTTLEERIDDLQLQVNDLKSDIQKQTAGLQQKISDVQNTLDGQIRSVQSALDILQKNIRDVTVGGVKLQLFGVYLVIHGAIAGYFS